MIHRNRLSVIVIQIHFAFNLKVSYLQLSSHAQEMHHACTMGDTTLCIFFLSSPQLENILNLAGVLIFPGVLHFLH